MWRELRRAKSTPEGILTEAFEAADSGQWSEFIKLMGGTHSRRKEQPVKLAKVWNEQDGKYGEPLGWQIFGVEADNQVLATHLHTWTIDFADNIKKQSLANISIHSQKMITETPGADISTGAAARGDIFADDVCPRQCLLSGEASDISGSSF